MVETSDHDGHHVTSHQLGQTLERQTVDACSESFFDCAYGALNLTDMTVGRHEVEVNWTYFVAYAVEFLVGVSITRDETSRLVQFEHGAGFLQDDVLAAIVNWLCGAETYAARDCGRKVVPVQKKICAYRDVAGAFKDLGAELARPQKWAPKGPGRNAWSCL